MMKYLKSFNKFEALTISLTDDPEDKVAKEEINKTEKYLKDYSVVRAEIDNAFLSIKDNENLNAKISEISKKNAGNPLIDEYVKVSALQRRVKDAQEELSSYSDEIFRAKEEAKELARSKSDAATIQAKTKMVTDIEKKQAEKKTDIDILKKEVLDAEKKMKDQMEKMKKDSADNMANL
jgi:hypothetical protein